MANTILRLPQVKTKTGLSNTTIYRYIASDLFPKPIRLGNRAVGWIETEINDWIEQRIQESRKSA